MADAKDQFPKAYEPAVHEDAVYAAWHKSGYFNPDELPGKRKESFTIVMPPPNVTGTLHLGHAVMLAIEDLMVRFERMRGKRALWIPGTDHAAIATQTKVEKLVLEKEKKTRHDLGRDEFLKRVNTFASESHDTIVNQVKKMGSSCDWSREAYTLDGERSEAVNEAFSQLHEKGLLYRGNRVINWCPRCQSTLADDEVVYKEERVPFYYFKYGPITIATARPETKFLDKTIVVHPDDDRYKSLIGKEFEVEWIDGMVKANVIADPTMDKEFGTGAMTITPAHDFHDFELAQMHGLPVVQIIDDHGNFTEAAGSFAGRNARESRADIVATLKKKGLVERVDEEYVHNISLCYRCDTPIEPLPKLQWFIAVNKHFAFTQSKNHPVDGLKNGQEVTLKEVMIHVVKSGQIKILPEHFEKTYYHWIENLRDWCISRQLWFGHQIPVWYHSEKKGDDAYEVSETSPGKGWTRDADTLDTWFSSGLWTFSTLGWPNAKAKDLAAFHPTSVLETGYDILFFWIARMVLMSTALVGEVPFKTVYLHGLVRDEQGRKMSKSLGNIIDPLDMIAKYGTDAVRLSLVIGSTPGNDVRLSEEKIAGFRNFTNKLWNIGRFVLTTTDSVGTRIPRAGRGNPAPTPVTLADRWILSRLSSTVEKVTAHLSRYEFSLAGELLRDFTWSDFADWYIEIAKSQKKDADPAQTDAVLRYVLDRVLRLWHPFMPFVTEVLWKQMGGGGVGAIHELPLLVSDWPEQDHVSDQIIERQMQDIQAVVVAIRNLRSEHRISPKQLLSVTIVAGNEVSFLEQNQNIIADLVRAEIIHFEEREKQNNEIVVLSGSVQIFVVHQAESDDISRAKLSARAEELERYILSIDTKLANEEFTAKAPPAVINKEKAKRVAAAEELEKIRKQLAS